MLILSYLSESVVTEDNDSSSINGHRFTVDESSVYWTQQANEDQRPQFKNHQKPNTAESLHPPPSLSPPSSSIYQTDDQHDQRLDSDDDQQFIPIQQRKDITVAVSKDASLIANAATPTSNKNNLIDDSLGDIRELNEVDVVSHYLSCTSIVF